MSKNPKEDKSTYFLDVEMQALAKLFAEEFNKRKPPKVRVCVVLYVCVRPRARACVPS